MAREVNKKELKQSYFSSTSFVLKNLVSTLEYCPVAFQN